MAGLFEVYDNEQVQLVTRRQAAVTFLVFAAALGETLFVIILAREGLLPLWLAIILTVGVWVVAGWRLIRHVRRTNHIVWCVKISPLEIAGYDYARRKTSLDWCEIEQVDLAREGLLIRGRDERHLEIPHLFPEFASLSHRIVEHAERHDVPIMVDGCSWENLDVHALYPFLSSEGTEFGGGSGSLRV